MPEDAPGEEQPTMLSFTEAAERLVRDHIAPNMTAEGLRRLARDPDSGWPIAESDYQVVRRVRLLPYEVLAPYVEGRLGKRRGRGPARQPRKKRTIPPKQPGEPVTTTIDARRDLYAFAMEGKEHSPAISDRASDKIDAFRTAVIDEVVQALQERAGELSDLAEEKMRSDLEEQAQEWHRAADVAAKLKRAKTEATDG